MKTINDMVDILLAEDIGKKSTKKIETGLSREEAMKAHPYSKSMGDCRGFSYDPKTGVATWV